MRQPVGKGKRNCIHSGWIAAEDADRALEVAADAIDEPAMSVSGNPFGGGGCYSPAWERLLEFCPVAPELICAGSAAALAAWPWGYPPGANDSSEPLETKRRASSIIYAGFLK